MNKNIKKLKKVINFKKMINYDTYDTYKARTKTIYIDPNTIKLDIFTFKSEI